jgi:hypothetical protein
MANGGIPSSLNEEAKKLEYSRVFFSPFASVVCNPQL